MYSSTVANRKYIKNIIKLKEFDDDEAWKQKQY